MAAAAFRDFIKSEAAGGLLLIGAAALALVAANLPATQPLYDAFTHLKIGPAGLHFWVNDALMALFFLLVGLEIKRELIGGELARPEDRRLPVAAAIAGMAIPALIYLAAGAPTRGWAIPAATDIAFAIGVLALLGPRVPVALKLFLTTVAIVDDMGAVAIIAAFYTDTLNLWALAGAAVAFGAMLALNRAGVMQLWLYLLGFGLLWALVLASGIHATIAGVLAALAIPIRAEEQASPLHRLEHGLHPWIAFGVVPLFGFVNAGVALGAVTLTPLAIGIGAGLFLGKQIGILGAVWAVVRLGWAARPVGASWAQIYGVALLCGIGFTMSLFIAGLAFPDQPALVEQAKIGILGGSLLSALAGWAVLRFAPAARVPI